MFVSRFLPVLHSLVPLTVGMSTMRYRRFIAWTLPACLIWATAYVTVGATAVVYCGSTLLHNPEMQEILRWVTAMHGATAHFPEHGAFCGALGAVAMLDGDAAHPG